MICENCNERPALFIINGEDGDSGERRGFCGECARELGITDDEVLRAGKEPDRAKIEEAVSRYDRRYLSRGPEEDLSFDSIIGYSCVKKELERISDYLRDPVRYGKLGVRAPSGLLLHGKPGVGKTLMAHCLIRASTLPYHVCRRKEHDDGFLEKIRKTFAKASGTAPCIVFLDDMDKFSNSDRNHRDAEEYVTVQSCIDDVRGKGVFVLATANDKNKLPDSLLRPGRFDRIMEIDVPRGDDGEKIIAHYLKGKKFVSESDAKAMARMTAGRSCAELESVLNEAGLIAGYEGAEEITMSHFTQACVKTIFCDSGYD